MDWHQLLSDLYLRHMYPTMDVFVGLALCVTFLLQLSEQRCELVDPSHTSCDCDVGSEQVKTRD